jgi:SAM-dependent methyltransferase
MPYNGFPRGLTSALSCPKDGQAVLLSEQDLIIRRRAIWRGSLVCRLCGSRYPVKDGIACLLPDREAVDPVLRTEIERRDIEAEKYEQKFKARFHKEIPSAIRAVGPIAGKRVIEYGAGTGRFTEIFSKDADFYLAVDFSFQSLKIAAGKIISAKTGLVLADAISLVTANAFFDIALAFQLIEHVPTGSKRGVFFEHVRETIKTGGLFLSSTYHQDLRRIFKGEPKSGSHRTGIHFHYFSVGELCREISRYFKVSSAYPFDITLPFEAKMKLSPEVGGKLSRALEWLPVINKFGHLILVKAIKK